MNQPGDSAGGDVRLWNEEAFAHGAQAWTALLNRSSADALFMSWQWQRSWWEHHRSLLNATLHLLAVHSPSGELIGLAPLYSHTVRSRALVGVRRLELMGAAWRNDAPAFSEYLDVIAARGHEQAVLDAIATWLRSQSFWQDLAITAVREDSLVARLARETLSQIAYVRDADPMVSYAVTLPRSFADYVAGLGDGTRRRLFGQRRKLSNVSLSYANDAQIAESLALLRRFKSDRWAGALQGESLQRFHESIARSAAASNSLRLSVLSTDGVPLSVMFNIRAGNTEYYLQSAFDVTRASGLSPGYLHFGYAMEQACQDGVTRFDFLGGRGLNRDYKQDLSAEPCRLVCYHAVRAPLLRALHASYAWTRRAFARSQPVCLVEAA